MRSCGCVAHVDEEGKVSLTVFGRPVCRVVSLAGYEKISVAADISATDNLVLDTIVLKEIIAKPVNLKVYGSADDGFTLTWNESGEIFDDFES